MSETYKAFVCLFVCCVSWNTLLWAYLLQLTWLQSTYFRSHACVHFVVLKVRLSKDQLFIFSGHWALRFIVVCCTVRQDWRDEGRNCGLGQIRVSHAAGFLRERRQRKIHPGATMDGSPLFVKVCERKTCFKDWSLFSAAGSAHEQRQSRSMHKICWGCSIPLKCFQSFEKSWTSRSFCEHTSSPFWSCLFLAASMLFAATMHSYMTKEQQHMWHINILQVYTHENRRRALFTHDSLAHYCRW